MSSLTVRGSLALSSWVVLTTPTVQETKDLSSVRSIPQSQLAAQCATVSEDTQPKRSVLTVARTAKETKTRNERILVQQEKKNDDFAGVKIGDKQKLWIHLKFEIF